MTRTLDEQTQSLANWMPDGRAFGAKNIQDSVTRRMLEGFAGELLRNEALLEEFKEEVLPDKTTEFLGEWERAVGIPCECFDGTGTIEERRNDVLAKLAALGVQTAEDMRILAQRIYGIDVSITTPELTPGNTFPYVFPLTFGISEREARFTLIITYNDLPNTVKFPLTFPIPFLTREIGRLECLFEKVRPANVGFFTRSEIPPPEPEPYENSPYCLEFTHSGERLSIDGDSATEYDFNFGDAWTVAAWVKAEDDSPNARSVILGLGQGVNHNRLWLSARSVAGDYHVHVYDEVAPNHGNVKNYAFGSLEFGAWHFVAVTWDGVTDELKCYVDGVEDASPTKIDDDVISLSNIPIRANIGANGNYTGGNEFLGRIYQVGLWSAVLSQAEIEALFNEGEALTVNWLENFGNYASATDLDHWWWPGAENDPNLGRDHGLNPVDISTPKAGIGDPNRKTDYPTN